MENIAKKLFLKHTKKTFLKPAHIEDLVYQMLGVFYPHFCEYDFKSPHEIYNQLIQIKLKLEALFTQLNISDKNKIDSLIKKFPSIVKSLDLDAKSAYAGDPAAGSLDEILVCYPGFFAISVHRIAHELYLLNIPILPRMISEFAHSKTGIDIHPGAQIGKCFFIDHGTGIVIGETSIIGNNVKIYQGVTLGALSVRKHLQNKKRHPTIKDNCVIYANATILGGKTVIGKNSVIGGSTWITESVPQNSILVKKKN